MTRPAPSFYKPRFCDLERPLELPRVTQQVISRTGLGIPGGGPDHVREEGHKNLRVIVHLPCVRVCARQLGSDSKANLLTAGVCAAAYLLMPLNP